MRPLSGLMNPSSVRIIVLLPAPFGPEQPDRARRKRRRDVFERELRTVADAHVLENDDRRLVSHAG